MSKPTLKELKTQVKELQVKIERFEEPLDYQKELEAVLIRFGIQVYSSQCGGPVVLKGVCSDTKIEIATDGRAVITGFDSLGRDSIRLLANLCDAINDSHGC